MDELARTQAGCRDGRRAAGRAGCRLRFGA
jgi:hypothetical protein